MNIWGLEKKIERIKSKMKKVDKKFGSKLYNRLEKEKLRLIEEVKTIKENRKK